jgi:hypothetical protein
MMINSSERWTRWCLAVAAALVLVPLAARGDEPASKAENRPGRAREIF